MERNGIFVVLLISLFVFDAANASLLGKSRKLVDAAGKDNSTATQNSPLQSPVPVGKPSDQKPTGSGTTESQHSGNSSSPIPKGSTKPDSLSPPPQSPSENHDTVVPNSKEQSKPPPEKQVDENKTEKGSNETKSLVPPPPNKEEDEKSKDESRKTQPASPTPVKNSDIENDDDGNSGKGSSETCAEISNRCKDDKTLVACTLNAESGKWLILVQNEGENTLKVKILLPTSVKDPLKNLTLSKHQSERVNVPVSGGTDNKIILDAGHGECTLHMGPLVPEDGILFRLPSYEKLVTPINGAYFLVISVVLFGGTWACCCLFRKRKRQDGIPYQELEMGATESNAIGDLETAEGWDQGWDDDWDEESSVKSPGGRNVRSISENGLTARSANKDGWDNDWDD